MTKSKAIAIPLLVLLIFSMVPTILFVNAQTKTTVEDEMVKLAMQTGKEIEKIITSVYATENATQEIQKVGLLQQFEGNVTLYQNDGLNQVRVAQEALAKSNSDIATDSVLKALKIFREVYQLLQGILEKAGLEDKASINNQILEDAINRETQSVGNLHTLLYKNATTSIRILRTTDNTLLQAKELLQQGKNDEAQELYLQAKQNITQIYQGLKTQAEESNTWRLSGYCQILQQSIQEKFSYGNQNSINFTTTLQSLGYQNENLYMQALQTKIQNTKAQSNIESAINECLAINQMVQQMQQALNNDITQQQGPNPSNSIGATIGPNNGAENTPGGNSTNRGSSGGNNTGTNGSSINGKMGNG